MLYLLLSALSFFLLILLLSLIRIMLLGHNLHFFVMHLKSALLS